MEIDAGPHFVKLSAAGVELNVNVVHTTEGISISVLRQNDPTKVDQLRKAFETESWDGRLMNLKISGGYTRRAADTGYLRSAYLLAFAKFGYRWSVTADKDIIRQQIREHSLGHLDEYRIYMNATVTLEPRCILIAAKPFRALAVKMDQSVVLLPWFGGPPASEISERIAAEKGKTKSTQFTFEGKMPWPKGMEMQADQ